MRSIIGIIGLHPGHPATFNGKHNASKSKVFIVLYDDMFNQGGTAGLTRRELHQRSGVPLSTLKRCLPLWVRWEYVHRKARVADSVPPGRPRLTFFYQLSVRGKRFVEERIPPDRLKQYIGEIKAFRAKQKIEKKEVTP